MRGRAAFISHSDCGRHDTGWGHPEHVGRLRAITRALRDDPELFHSIEHLEGRHATIEELELAHDPAYVRSVRTIAEQGGGRLDTDMSRAADHGTRPRRVPAARSWAWISR